jgi:uncharacterized protein YbbC (DUF1343 family)
MLHQLPRWFREKRLGLLANQASVTHDFVHTADLILAAGGQLRCLFSPQHGFNSEKQANMRESADDWNQGWQLPVFSLYGEVRQPTPAMLSPIDILLVDLQDVGARVYTYGITMGLCLEAASQLGVKVVILDRANPISGRVIEGNLLSYSYRSFVGRYPIPMRHGLTMGELARLIVQECRLDCDLEVIPMEGWTRNCFFSDTALPWVFPSPNVPSYETTLLYPGMVLFEGTNISEGRGTTLPFQLFGAPFLNQEALLGRLPALGPEGVAFRPVSFEPMFDKWQGEMCYGFQIHITDHLKLRPYRLALSLLQALRQTHPDQFQWLPPPYEYETEKLPIDILIGNADIRPQLEGGAEPAEVEANWQEELAAYQDRCRPLWLYS